EIIIRLGIGRFGTNDGFELLDRPFVVAAAQINISQLGADAFLNQRHVWQVLKQFEIEGGGFGGVARQIEIIGQLEAELGTWRVKLFDTIQEREGFDARIRFLSRRLNAKIDVKFRKVEQEL